MAARETQFKCWCFDCAADGTTGDAKTAVWLVEGHAERHPDHAPDYKRVVE